MKQSLVSDMIEKNVNDFIYESFSL